MTIDDVDVCGRMKWIYDLPKKLSACFCYGDLLTETSGMKKGFACRQRHPLNEFMDVLGSPQGPLE